MEWIYVQFSSVAQSCPTLCDPMNRGARPPCPPTPGVYSNSCASSRWCHPAISSSVVPFSSCPHPSQHQSLFHWVSLDCKEIQPVHSISPGCSLEGLMLRLKLQYFGHLMRRADSLEKTLMLGGIGAGGEGDDRGWDGWMASPTRWTWVRVNSRSWWWTGRPGMLQFMGLQRVGNGWVTELNWTEEFYQKNLRPLHFL